MREPVCLALERSEPPWTATDHALAIAVGVAAAAGAFGVAALISMATAPTARADDFTDVINAVDFDYSTGTTLLYHSRYGFQRR